MHTIYIEHPTHMAQYEKFTHLLTYMEQTAPNEFGETLMELSAEARKTLDEESPEQKALRAKIEEDRQDWEALLLLNIRETKRIAKTYRGRTGLSEAMQAGVLAVREKYFAEKAMKK